jgi:hypothetical protein
MHVVHDDCILLRYCGPGTRVSESRGSSIREAGPVVVWQTF